jgi:hypothetical protein
MTSDKNAPRHYLGVMISSTFTDLEKHRAALIDAINGQELKDVALERSSAKLVDVIDSSLQMVRDASDSSRRSANGQAPRLFGVFSTLWAAVGCATYTVPARQSTGTLYSASGRAT